MSPQRIQRKRTKGWRTPRCSCGCGKPAIYVGTPNELPGLPTCTRCHNPVDPGRDLCTRCAQHEAIAYHTNRLRNGNQVDPSAAATTTNPSPTIPPINNHGGRMPPPPEPAWLDEPEPEEIL